MTYKCLECGHIFENGEEARWVEKHGFDHGIHEEWAGCPLCKGSYEETEQCKICGSEHLSNELFGGVCKECIDEYGNNLEMCKKISLESDTAIKINSLLASVFETSDIEAILFEYIQNKMPDRKFDEYIEEDIEWFGEQLAREVNK